MATTPLGLRYSINSLNQAVLSWQPAPFATGYNIYKRTDSLGSFGTPINSVPVTGFTYTDVTFNGNIENYYTVTSIDAAPSESLPSITVHVPYQSGSLYTMPRVDLWGPAFDKFVTERGYDVVWEKAISCPCNKSTKSTTDATDLNCPLCRNKHFIWTSPEPIKAMMTSLTRDFNLEEDGIYQAGAYKVTTPSRYKIGFYDRLTFTECTAPLSEVVTKGTAGGADTLRFPAISVTLPIIDINGNYYTSGEDFIVNSSGQIVWAGVHSPQRQPPTGSAYGISYMAYWRMLSTEYSHDIRSTHAQLGTSSPVFVDMARQCIARLEWFFDM